MKSSVRLFRNSMMVVPALLLAGISIQAQTALSASQAARPVAASPTSLMFRNIAAQKFPEPPFTVSASSASTGAVTYSVVSGPATISGNTLTVTSGGVVQLAAIQAATMDYPAMKAKTSFTVSTATSEDLSFSSSASAVSSSPDADTPNYLFIDRNGKFYLQNSFSQYDTAPADHFWDFYTGTNAQDPHLALAKAHSIYDTQAMCTTGSPVYTDFYSVTGRTPGPKAYRDGNFCDVMGVWVDPDTGDWYGVVHNEIYPNAPRIDAISYAISTDQGRSWTLQAPIATSPNGVGDNSEHYYYYGDGDPRLIVDNASGYFYIFYFSRIMTPHGKGFASHTWEHVMRAPISQKMLPGSWQKYYNGGWRQTPGANWICNPAKSSCSTGKIAASLESNIGPDGDPVLNEKMVQPISAQRADDLHRYGVSDLTNMNISWDIYLQRYLAETVDKKVNRIQFYTSDDLASQKWTYAGSVPYTNSGTWYQWMVDAGNVTSSNDIGRTFYAYCSVDCSAYDSEYVTVTASLNPGVKPPAYYTSTNGVISKTNSYTIAHFHAHAANTNSNTWTFIPSGDGYFYIEQGGKYLQVSGGDAGRAWGAAVSLAAPMTSSTAPELSQQQWWFEQIKDIDGKAQTAKLFRLVNRYSGLALSFTGSSLRSTHLSSAVTAPIRDWDVTGATVQVWPSADQKLVLLAR